MERRKKIIALFKEMDFQLNISQFDDRLIAQKIVCLLELKGLKLGYPHGIYVRGPYSPDLTTDLYAFADEFEEFKTETRLNTNEKDAADNLNGIFGLKPVLLEVGATYGYYTRRENCDPFEALKRVKQLKPFYSQARIAVGVSKAKEYLFEPTAKDLEELRKEIEPWQRAALRSMRH